MAESNPRRLDQPKVRNRRLALDVDPETFGRFSESAARFMGTGKFLFWQTLVVIIWIALNLAAGMNGLWDKYPFILLNLLFSTQAAYAAPLILLAQNRQDDRDRISLEDDRSRAAQTKADTEFLARELAALRVAIGEVATRDYLRGEIERLRSDLEKQSRRAKKKSKSGTPSKSSAKSKRTGHAASPERGRPRPDPVPPEDSTAVALQEVPDANGADSGSDSERSSGPDPSNGSAESASPGA